MKRSFGAEGGFTLIELMVALAIFAMIAVAGVAMLSGAVNAQAAVATKLDGMAAVQRAASLLTVDLAQAVPRISRTETGTLAPAFFARGSGGAATAPALQFVRSGRTNIDDAARSTLQKLEYAVVGGRLERRSYPLVDGSQAGAASTILDGVSAASFRFRGPDGAWRDDWTVTNPLLLPRAVELTVVRAGAAPVRMVFLVGVDPVPEDANASQ